VGNWFKRKFNSKREAFWDSDEDAWDWWERATASQKRVMYTKWGADAWAELCAALEGEWIVLFQQLGLLLAADGSEDDLLKIRQLPDLKFPTEEPPAPVHLTKRVRREKAVREVAAAGPEERERVQEWANKTGFSLAISAPAPARGAGASTGDGGGTGRTRQLKTPAQLKILEDAFAESDSLGAREGDLVAELADKGPPALDAAKINAWFSNRRGKAKRDAAAAAAAGPGV
jgi:hypothetical protein